MVIDPPRAAELSHLREYASVLGRLLEATRAWPYSGELYVGDEMYLRFYHWAAWMLDPPRP